VSEQAVSDLVWAVSSPSFVSGSGVEGPTALDPDEIDAERLAAFLDGRSTRRVGHYFEHLLDFWFRHIRQVEVRASGLQVREGKRTIGELDFVYVDEHDRLTHCEASVKFFLHHSRPGESSFPGPNATDNSRGNPPGRTRSRNSVRPQWWHTSSRASRSYGSRLLARLVALAPRTRQLAQPGRRRHDRRQATLARTGTQRRAFCDRLAQHFHGGPGYPLMVSIRDKSTLREIERMFVVPDHWPN